MKNDRRQKSTAEKILPWASNMLIGLVGMLLLLLYTAQNDKISAQDDRINYRSDEVRRVLEKKVDNKTLMQVLENNRTEHEHFKQEAEKAEKQREKDKLENKRVQEKLIDTLNRIQLEIAKQE